MADETQGKPESAPADATVTPTAPAVVPSNQSEDFATQIARANDPAAIRALLDKTAQPAPPPAAKPAESKSGEKPAEAKPGESEKPTEETKPEETAEAEPGEEKPAEAPEAEPGEGEGDSDAVITALKGNRAHLRLPPESDQVGRLALALLKRNRDWTLKQATDAAEKQLGVEPEKPKEATAPEKTAEKPATPGTPSTIEEVDAETDRLEEEKAKATQDLRFEDVAKLDRQLRKLDRQRGDLVRENERTQAEKATQAETTYNQQFDSSVKRASELYDFAADAASEGGKRMLEIEEALKAGGDPLFNSPNKPLVIAQMVARELRIPPKSAKSAVKPVAKPAPAPTAKPKSVLTEGGATTTPPAKDQQGKLADSINGVRNLGELKKLAAGLGLNL